MLYLASMRNTSIFYQVTSLCIMNMLIITIFILFLKTDIINIIAYINNYYNLWNTDYMTNNWMPVLPTCWYSFNPLDIHAIYALLAPFYRCD